MQDFNIILTNYLIFDKKKEDFLKNHSISTYFAFTCK